MGYDDAEQADLRADLTAMYQAGRHDLPDMADALADVGKRMDAVIEGLDARAAQTGDPTVMQDVLAVSAQVYAAVSHTVTNLSNAALGVVYAADQLRGRDEFAQSVFAGLDADLKHGDPDRPPPEELDPIDPGQLLDEGAGSDYEPTPDVQSPEDELADRNEDLADDQDAIDEPTGER